MHGIYDIGMSFVQMVCTNWYQSASKPRVSEMGVLQIGIRVRVSPEFLKWVCYKLVSERE
jgi:hypothetical protein